MEIFDIKYTPGVRSGAVRFYARNLGQKGDAETPALLEMIKNEQEKGFDRVDVFLDYAAKVNATREQLL